MPFGFKNHNFTQAEIDACRHINDHNSQLANGMEQARLDFIETVQNSADCAEMREKYPRLTSAEIAELMWEHVLPSDYEREIKRINATRPGGKAQPGKVIDLDAQQSKKKGWF